MSEGWPWSGRRAWVVSVVVGSTMLVTPACSRLRHPFSSGGVKTRAGTLSVTPPSGSVGTAFSLVAGGFRAGEPMTFEIDIPKHPRFVGPSHLAGADGRVTSTYTPLNGDPPGTYLVKAVGSRGTRAQGHLDVLGGAPSTSTTR
jgi:hypothetical protein